MCFVVEFKRFTVTTNRRLTSGTICAGDWWIMVCFLCGCVS